MSAAPGGLRGWLLDQAVPLWTGAGWDAATGTVWEALDHAGRPRRDLDRRLRVQARQAYAFATLARQPGVCPALAADLRARAEGLFDFVMTRGFAPGSGNLASWLAPDLTIRTAPHDLYDLSFVLLAAAGLASEIVAFIDGRSFDENTTPSAIQRLRGSSNGPNLSGSIRAIGRAPMAKMSRRMPPTPVAAPW